jgi:flagellar P-ring protein precursor FlgI
MNRCTTLTTLALALAALGARAQDPVEVPLRLVPSGIEAPAQPAGRSSSGYERGGRFVPPTPSGARRGRVSAPIGSLMRVRGQEENTVIGVGLVTGLAGTGDSVNMIRQSLQNLLLASNIKIAPQQLTSKNVALVMVEASLPAGIQPGRQIDCRVSTIGDAKSLVGGVLTLMELTDVTGSAVYATASGPVDVGGFLIEGESAQVQQNHPTVGMVPGGAKVERAVRARLVSDHGWLYLDARAEHGSYDNLAQVVESINQLYPGAAQAESDGRAVKVRVPEDIPAAAHVAYVNSILQREIEPTSPPVVIVNERTGMVVMGEGVRLRAGAIAKGDLTVTIAESPEASQPGPLSAGGTEVLPRTDLRVEEEDNALVALPGAVTLQEVVEVLNVLGTTPRDLISILEAMSSAGLLLAEIRRM